jgi:multiple RNA-binding domain-containing protein 1
VTRHICIGGKRKTELNTMPAAAGADADALSTRLIVKNLPKHADDKRLREHFAKQGRVTDAKVARTKDGKSRLFGFVGYASHAEAAQALKFFDRSFLDTGKLSVELAHRKGDASIARPWSRHSAGSSLNAKATGKRSAAAAADGADGEQYEVVDVKAKRARTAAGGDSTDADTTTGGDSQVKSLEKREFMEAMKPRSDTKFWANDDALAGGEVAAAAPLKQKSLKRQRAASDAGSSSSSSSSDSNSSGSAADSDAEASDDAVADADHVSETAAAASDTAVSHLDWLRSKTSTSAALADTAAVATTAKAASAAAIVNSDDSSSSDDSCSDYDETVKPATAAAATAKKQADISTALSKAAAVKSSNSSSSSSAATAAAGKQRSSSIDSATSITDTNNSSNTVNNDSSNADAAAAASGRLFIRNLAYSCSEADLTAVFEQYGELSSVHVAVDDVQQQCKGFAFVQYAAAGDAANALDALDGTSFQGRLLHIIPARRAPGKKTLRNMPILNILPELCILQYVCRGA